MSVLPILFETEILIDGSSKSQARCADETIEVARISTIYGKEKESIKKENNTYN